MLTIYQAPNWALFAVSTLKYKIYAKNDPNRLKDDTYVTIILKVKTSLIQLSSIIYFKNRAYEISYHNCHSSVLYNQPSEQSIQSRLSLHYTAYLING